MKEIPMILLQPSLSAGMEHRNPETRVCFRCHKPGHIKANCTAPLPPPLPPLQLPPLPTALLANDSATFLARVTDAALARYNNGEGNISNVVAAIQAALACSSPRRDPGRRVTKASEYPTAGRRGGRNRGRRKEKKGRKADGKGGDRTGEERESLDGRIGSTEKEVKGKKRLDVQLDGKEAAL
ncbi:hypothetical protein W97_09105 [Coniosporium apollinis CBS 100218]|uniref:CCHC-type domain-containing protein n=1 Tax=Coniosporium apollinis (strain CBS 100218) TaxID=1168221 RepID=R7Z6P3_CONA1|nr:uncharacterized protein W97_09105 [Coniosporium apollinis CBS 100218]EON69842.1 hypothetical protein W97_09105 [Coniosporium apollinis CBS 100218]